MFQGCQDADMQCDEYDLDSHSWYYWSLYFMKCRDCGATTSRKDKAARSAHLDDRAALSKHLARLREGHKWLSKTWKEMETEAPDGKVERQFLKALDARAGMEREVRLLYGFRGCVTGPEGCPEASPVRCESCAEEHPPAEDGAPGVAPKQAQLEMETGALRKMRSV